MRGEKKKKVGRKKAEQWAKYQVESLKFYRKKFEGMKHVISEKSSSGENESGKDA